MRLIDADELLRKLPREELVSRMIVAGMPTIDAEPVRRGQWVRYYHSHREDDFSINCSLCFRPVVWPSPYCPQCGALMEEQEGE